MTKPNPNKFIEKLIATELSTLSLKELFALKLEYLYLCSGMSQLNFSFYININYSYFNDLIRGKKYITLTKIDNICKALNITPAEMFNFDILYQLQESKQFK
jgi:transcriptional regulator with XRE-family HTH domain